MSSALEKFREGSVVQLLTDNSRGIIVSKNRTFINVLFENYRVIPIKYGNAKEIGKYVDLGIIWNMIRED